MLLVGDRDGIFFKCNDLTCILTSSFNIILYTEYTAVYDGKTNHLGFIIPVKYLSFIKTLNRSFTLQTELDKIFLFKNAEDKAKMQEYVSKQSINSTFKIIPDLVQKSKRRKSTKK